MIETLGGSAEGLIGQAWLIAGTFLYCIGSGFIFVMNAELYLLAVSAISPPGAIAPLILAASLGQMVAKSAMYLGGRGVLKLPLGKYQEKMDKVSEKLHRSRAGPGGFVFLSASTGLPPFYLVSILAGTLRLPFLVFFLPGFAGRLIRFGLLVLSPQLAKGGLL
jgi:membrane protein YqaA with SNARE-associated domain